MSRGSFHSFQYLWMVRSSFIPFIWHRAVTDESEDGPVGVRELRPDGIRNAAGHRRQRP